MKILVADDDVVARKVLRAFLQQSNYEPVIVEDGEAALAALLAPDGPQIAIVDWMMPGLNGTDLCSRLRNSDLVIQPYVIMLSSKSEKGVIVEALDVGADAIKKKPFNIQDMHAQLRAGERAILHQHALCSRVGRPVRVNATVPPGVLPASVKRGNQLPAPAHGDASQPTPTPQELEGIVAEALRGLGFGHALRRERHGNDRRIPRAWSGFLFRKERRWLDLVFETDDASLVHLREFMANQKSFGTDVRVVFHHEFPRAVCDGIRHTLSANGHQGICPLRPLTTVRDRRPVMENEEAHHFSVAGRTYFTFVLAPHASPLLHKPPLQLCEHDMLAEAYPPVATLGVPLLKQGVVLTDRLIKKLTDFAEAAQDVPPVPVYQPSPLAQHFNPGTHSPAPKAESGRHAYDADHETKENFVLDTAH